MNVNTFDTSDQFMHLQTIQLTSTKAIVQGTLLSHTV